MAASTRVTIAVDAMGGDHAPAEVVRGALLALDSGDLELLLVGDPDRLAAELPPDWQADDRLHVIPAREVIGMGEQPVRALKQKKDASITVAMEQVRCGRAAAVVSAGSTGATLAAALFQWGRIPGVHRPSIAVPYPSARGTIFIVDGGANVDCRPEFLAQFAVLGSIYAEQALQLTAPPVGLVNVGEERGKGDELTQAAYELIADLKHVNFIGNIEGRDIPTGKARVIVCDGFVGNTILKLGEGLLEFFLQILAEHARSQGWLAKVGAEVFQDVERHFRQLCDYAELGGGLLLGVQGTCVIGHGSSRARAIQSAIRVATEAVQKRVLARTFEAFASQVNLEVP